MSLGITLSELGLQEQITDDRRKLRNLREKEARLLRDRMHVNSEIGQLRSQLQDLQQEHTTLISDEDRISVVTELEHRARELQQQIIELDAQCDSLSQEHLDCTTDLSPLISVQQKISKQLQNLEQHQSKKKVEMDRISNELKQREEEYKHLLIQIEDFQKTAIAFAERPESVRDTSKVREEQIQVTAMINTISATARDYQAFEEQKKVVTQLREYIKQRQLHLENLMTDVDRRLAEWRQQLEETIETLNHRMNQLLSHFLKQVKLIIRYPDEPSRAELHLQLAINRKGAWRTYQEMSGGERVLATQTFILALHTIAKSPLHVIDEFTQRLDEASRAAVLSVVQRALDLTETESLLLPQFLLMAPSTVGLQIPKNIHHVVLIKGQVKN